MSSAQDKDTLLRYLDEAREAMLWKLDGLSEYDVRRPMAAHGTNLLGLVKHLAGCEIGYFGYVFSRPFPQPPAWLTSEEGEPTRDMWATAEESRHDIVSLYRRACAHSNATIDALDLGGRGEVPGWPEHRRSVTLHDILVHMLSETARHAGHADILRELIDEAAGLHANSRGLPDTDSQYWPRLREHIEHLAREAKM
ncbi:putative damage-inducible protein DinB [Mycobacterium frederiksbergense]|uniref:Damage-inducible protein DinB n=1 Tax=Mycolicibacterium frederiksbergense TaxID=117567 RepID=A0ABT6L107_9MYCO|nr:DinB family protein [Mycolicibacterium frederiksbergense]MDH6196633.1 putative damage-inducible protein DinB [Mycolicibacterium frederiksbergense]